MQTGPHLLHLLGPVPLKGLLCCLQSLAKLLVLCKSTHLQQGASCKSCRPFQAGTGTVHGTPQQVHTVGTGGAVAAAQADNCPPACMVWSRVTLKLPLSCSAEPPLLTLTVRTGTSSPFSM